MKTFSAIRVALIKATSRTGALSECVSCSHHASSSCCCKASKQFPKLCLLLAVMMWVVLTGSVAQAQTSTPWRASDIATGANNETKLLWRTSGNRFQIWNLTDGGQASAASEVFGPVYTDGLLWTPIKLGVGGDGLTHLLLRRSDGQAAIWLLNSNLTFNSSLGYGPFTGWTATDMAVASDGSLRLLWTKADGTFGLWTVTPSGTASYSPTFGPISNAAGTWTARRLAVGGDGNIRVLLAQDSGQATI